MIVRNRTQIIADLLEANDKLEISTYSGVNSLNCTFIYVDFDNGNDLDASNYFINNTTERHNDSTPFKTYDGVNGMIAFWENRNALNDTRFVDSWSIFVDLSKSYVWNSTIPTHTINSEEKPIIWCGFKIDYRVTFGLYNTLMYCENVDNGIFLSYAINDTGSFFMIDLFYSSFRGTCGIQAIGGYYGKVNTRLYKTKLVDVSVLSNQNGLQLIAHSSVLVNVFCRNHDTFAKAGSYTIMRVKNCIIYISDTEAADNTNAVRLTYNSNLGDIQNNLYVNLSNINTVLDNSKVVGDVQAVDIDNGIVYTKIGSEAIRNGVDSATIGLGVGYPQKENGTFSTNITNGNFSNVGLDIEGNLFVEHTDLYVVSATTNTVTLQPTASEVNGAYIDLKLRIVDESKTDVQEYDIVGYNNNVVTISGTFSNIPDQTSKYFISGLVESTVLHNETILDRIDFQETRKYHNGRTERGVFGLQLKTSNFLTGGRIPISGDVGYSSTLHDYKQQLPEFIRVDTTGLGSANENFDKNSATFINCKYQQLKIQIW